MKYKCPYCNKIIDSDTPPSICPKCKKSMIIPDNLRKKKFRDRKKEREKIAQVAKRERERLFTPNFEVKKNPAHLFIIMGVLAALGAGIIMQTNKKPEVRSEVKRIMRAEKELTVLRIALERFKTDCKRYPTEKEGLDSLVFNPNIDGWGGETRWRYINKIKTDQWRSPYQYSITDDEEVQVFSYGPDKTPNTPDDLSG
jgi:type II secretion system protein G